jgi:hypothetical protein
MLHLVELCLQPNFRYHFRVLRALESHTVANLEPGLVWVLHHDSDNVGPQSGLIYQELGVAQDVEALS